MANHKVKITIPKRDQWPTYWVLQKEYSPGLYELEVDDKQLDELKGDPVAFLAEVDGASINSGPTEVVPPVTSKPTAKGAR